MHEIDQLRRRQEQRLVPVLQAWNDAKEHLAKALALAESKEREFHEISGDVQRKLEALDLVVAMAGEAGNEIPAERLLQVAAGKPTLMIREEVNRETSVGEMAEESTQIRNIAAHTQGLGGLVRRSSRPLFSRPARSRYAALSILQ